MNPEKQPNSAVENPTTPYVGMRAFTRNEQTIFFGRKRDASLLRDKVFSARLTVVYGPSGVGKSSILHTLLIPFLEEEAARVIYFDNWTGDDPLLTLKAVLIAEAEKLKIVDPGLGAPSLADLVLLLKSADDRTVVLILDQFEEFFTHGNTPETLRKELGALIRASDLDVRVLLSLREEHLAALEPFRAEILTLFQSTYRLEPLNDDGVREAIEGPAKLFGVDFQPGLVPELINDFRHKDNVTRWDPLTGMAVDLPMLQLICSELWQEMTRRGQQTITRALYRNVGGQAGILQAYLRQVMPKSWSAKILTAQLMRYLAPSDGHKTSYSAENLAELAELGHDRVEEELKRLSDSEVRVLRDRSYEGNTFYELYHDRFISFIGPWRDKILQDDKRRRWWKRGLLTLFAIMLVIFGISEWRIREYKKYTDGEMKKLNHSMAAGDKKEIFEKVADYIFAKKREEDTLDKIAISLGRKKEGFDKLKQLFMEYEHLMPKDYGIEPGELLPYQRELRPRLFTLKYSPARKLDEKTFRETWKNNFTVDLTKSLGIIVPTRPNLLCQANESGERKLSLVGEGIENLDIEIPFYEEQAVIDQNPQGLTNEGKAFRDKFQSDWTPEGYWLVVPRWSIPAWKRLKINPTGGSAITAFYFVEELKKHPDRLLTVEAVNIMLDKVSEHSPQTVSEARAVRQEKLRQDLQEILKQGTVLTKLPLILDALAHYPEETSSEIASKVITDLKSAQVTSPHRLRGPHQTSVDTQACKTEIPGHYRKSDPELEYLNLKDQPIEFITADKVNEALSKMNKDVKSWLKNHYSLTDLKLLLRAVVNPAEVDVASKTEKPKENAKSTTYQSSPENSISQPAWLLASLVFWSQADDGKSFPALVEDLRRTQSARLGHEPTAPDMPQVVQTIKAGIKALNEGRVSEAEAAFAQALRIDKEAAVSSFLVFYPKEFQQSFIQRYTLQAKALAFQQELK